MISPEKLPEDVKMHDPLLVKVLVSKNIQIAVCSYLWEIDGATMRPASGFPAEGTVFINAVRENGFLRKEKDLMKAVQDHSLAVLSQSSN